MGNDRCNGAKNSNCATTANGADDKNLHQEGANVCSELCDTDPAPTQITVDYSGDLFAVYDKASAMRLLMDYRIPGHCMDGSTWNDDTSQLPMFLMPEQAQVLHENGSSLTFMVPGLIVIRQCQGFEGCLVERRPPQAIELDDNLMAKARLVVVGRKIKDRKRKLLGGQAPAQALKVRRKDETDFTDDIDEQEILAAAEELRERQRRENEKKESEDVLHVPLCGPSTSYAVLPSPPVLDTVDYARKFTVFRDLWRKGFYLTNGIKFGCDYLAYEQPPGAAHSKYMVFCFDASQSIAPLNLVSASRVASQSNKIRSNVSVPDDEEKIPRTTVVGFVASLCGNIVVVIAADRRRMFNKQPQDDADKFIEVENHRRIAVVGFSGEDWSIRQTAGATLCEYAANPKTTFSFLVERLTVVFQANLNRARQNPMQYKTARALMAGFSGATPQICRWSLEKHSNALRTTFSLPSDSGSVKTSGYLAIGSGRPAAEMILERRYIQDGFAFANGEELDAFVDTIFQYASYHDPDGATSRSYKRYIIRSMATAQEGALRDGIEWTCALKDGLGVLRSRDARHYWVEKCALI